MMRNQFTFYASFHKTIDMLPHSRQLEVYKQISLYALTGEEIKFKNLNNSILWITIKAVLDSGRNKALNKPKTSTIPLEVKVKEKDKEKDKEKEKGQTNTPAPTFIFLGEYENVKLTQDNIKDLKQSYGSDRVFSMITRLDEYIEESGKQYNNHKVIINKWIKEDR